jgi:hypothetical protein
MGDRPCRQGRKKTCRIRKLDACRQTDRICGTLSSRRSSANCQQSLRTQEPEANHNQHAPGALPQEELPLKALSTQDAYIIYAKNWMVPRGGNLRLEQLKTCLGRSLATSDRSGGRDQCQNQVCDVGFVFARPLSDSAETSGQSPILFHPLEHHCSG